MEPSAKLHFDKEGARKGQGNIGGVYYRERGATILKGRKKKHVQFTLTRARSGVGKVEVFVSGLLLSTARSERRAHP